MTQETKYPSARPENFRRDSAVVTMIATDRLDDYQLPVYERADVRARADELGKPVVVLGSPGQQR